MNTTTTIEKMIDSIAAVCINLGLRGEYSPEEIADLDMIPSGSYNKSRAKQCSAKKCPAT